MGNAWSVVSSKTLSRPAWLSRTNWYQEFDGMTDRIQTALEICLVVHPHGKVVNSVIVGKKRVQPDEKEYESARMSEGDCVALKLST